MISHKHITHTTLTLSSRNSGLMKSRRNQVSGGFSQSAIDLKQKAEKYGKIKEGVNIMLQHPRH